MKTIITYFFGPVLKRCYAQRWFSLAILAAVLLGSSVPARAQTVEESLQLIRDAIDVLDAPNESGLLMKITIIEHMLEQGNVTTAINQLNALAARLDASGNGTLEEIFDDIVASIDEVVADLLAPPGDLVMWYVDLDMDGYYVEVGLYTAAPFPYASNTVGNGLDCDDNDPSNRCPVCTDGGQMWYVDMDQDNYYVPLGCYPSQPIPGALSSYGEGIDCDDNDVWNLCELINP
jgi:hypothetical protein